MVSVELLEKIRQAQELVKANYEAYFRKRGVTPIKRNWTKRERPDGGLIFALEGTPAKGFVFVLPDGRVVAAQQNGEIIKVWR